MKNKDECLAIFEHFEIKTNIGTTNNLNIFDFVQNKIKDNYCEFQVNEFNLLSNDEKKILELIQMNLNVMLKKDYLLIGVINSSNSNIREYKMLFKKVRYYRYNTVDPSKK